MAEAGNRESIVQDGMDKHGPGYVSADGSLALRVMAAKVMLDNLVLGLRQIGICLADRPQHHLLALVEAEAERARGLLAGIVAGLQPANPAEMVLDGSLQRLMAMAGPQVARDLVARLGTDLDSVALALRVAGTAADWASLRGQSHILIALAGVAGARQLQTAAEEMNHFARVNDADSLHLALPGCLALIAALRDKIRTLPLPEDTGPAP